MRTIIRAVGLRLTPYGPEAASTFHAHGSPEEVAQKWYNRLSAATEEMQQGVDRVNVAPGQAAAQKRQKWVQSVTSQATQDKWARNVAAVSLGDWQQAMKTYGINRVAQGAQAKQQKFAERLQSLLAYTDQGVNKIKSMPDLTPADRENRAIAMMRWMRDYKRPA